MHTLVLLYRKMKDVNATLGSLYIVVELNVAVNNVKLFNVVMEMLR